MRTLKTKALLAVCLLALMSCGNAGGDKKGADSSADSTSVPKNVSEVVGLGKVEPLDGVAELAAQSGGIVEAISARAGDTVRVGQAILTLRHTEDSLKVAELNSSLDAQREQIGADRANTAQIEAQLKEKNQDLSTAQELAQTGAETRQKVSDLQTQATVLKSKLDNSQKAVSAGQAKLHELTAQLKAAEQTLDNKTVRAPSDGVLLTMDAKVGAALQPLASFADFAPKGQLTVHGEVDEMFADRLSLGLKADVTALGSQKTITTGRVSFLSPQLNDKSLFTDEPGEKQDRRVRRFKLALDSTADLLINNKVECIVHLKPGQR